MRSHSTTSTRFAGQVEDAFGDFFDDLPTLDQVAKRENLTGDTWQPSEKHEAAAQWDTKDRTHRRNPRLHLEPQTTDPMLQEETGQGDPVSIEPEVESTEAQQIIRRRLSEQLVQELRRLQSHAREPSSSTYAYGVFKVIKQFRDRIPTDVFTDFVMSLNNALSYEQAWADYSSDEIGSVIEVIRKYAFKDWLTENHVDKAISEIKEAGFEVTPFEINFND